MASLGQKIFAIGSGKGGVGKSTTALNIALLSAKSGMRTGIIDMDPLSNLGVILDIPEHSRHPAQGRQPEHSRQPAQAETRQSEEAGALSLADYTRNIFPRLDILFSTKDGLHHEFGGGGKTGGAGVAGTAGAGTATGAAVPVHTLIFDRFAVDLYRRYDVIIMDLPAGIAQDENLHIFPHLKNLVVVTNAEPTSHVSSGGYIKAALEVNKQLHFYIWNNKYEPGVDPGFNPNDLLSNYNRYAPAELRLQNSVKDRLHHIAYVPSDPALNLLKTGIDFRIELLFKIRESLQLLYEVVIPLNSNEKLPLTNRQMLRYYVLREHGNFDPKRILEYYEEVFLNADDPFKHRDIAMGYIQQQAENPLRKALATSLHAIDHILRIYQHRKTDATDGKRSIFVLLSRPLLRSLSMFGRLIERWGEENLRKRFGNLDMRMLKNATGLCFFYFTLARMLEYEKIRHLLYSFIPRKNKNGRLVRDRYRQIVLLIKSDKDYHRRYFNLIKALFPLMERQLYRLARVRKLEKILLYDSEGRIMRNTYLRLLSELMHELLNSGLGVHVGIHFNKAAREIQKGWEKLFSDNRSKYEPRQRV